MSAREREEICYNKAGDFERGETMSLVISDDILRAANMTAEELKQEIAIILFQRERLTLGQASQFAGLSQFGFQRLLASRHIPIHYDVDEFEGDLKVSHDHDEP